jgi:SAM-dependent methyltransferase
LKPGNASWFKIWFNTQDYLNLYKHRNTNDAKKIVSLISRQIEIKPGLKVLDLACGNGRHSILFAKKGCKVLGIDLSEYLISQAKKKLKSDYLPYRSNLKFEVRDMRNIRYAREFNLVVNLFSSFGYFDSDKQNEKVISGVSRALMPEGYFFFDFLNRDCVIKNLVPFDIKDCNGTRMMEMRQVKDGFVQKDILIFKKSGREPSAFRHFKEKVRLYSLPDFRKMFSAYGLKTINTFGDYEGNTFNKKNSQRLIILAQKRK